MTTPTRSGHSAPIWISPARMAGAPCLHGTRITINTVAHQVAQEGVAGFMSDYEVESRYDVLACCAWWTLNDRSRHKFDLELRQRWALWAKDAWRSLWIGNDDTAADTPDPP